MPRDASIKRVLLIGSGPIIIGQACEFDYSGTQACRALKEEGISVVLLNSNPATIMTDPRMADRTYVEPMTPETVERIIVAERVDSILPTMGGQTALNLVDACARGGIFRRRKVRLLGAQLASIRKAENRKLFRQAMARIGMDMPESAIATSVAAAAAFARKAGLPVILRPSFTLAGTGGGAAHTLRELEQLMVTALDLSPIRQVLVEESIAGWKEFELEVVRDRADNVIIVCSIENVDPMGVHTGDSITVAPAQTLSDEMFQHLRDCSKKIIREIGVDTGGSNIQFAVHPRTNRTVVIEMNPRVSRSSALASKATGYPIAKVAAKLAVGYTLDEITNDIVGTFPASFEPALDYIVTKVPRFAFEKFTHEDATLNSQMKSVGEVMAIGRNFRESLQKAIRGLEIGRDGLGADGKGMEPAVEAAERAGRGSQVRKKMRDILRYKIRTPNCDRIFAIKYGIQLGMTIREISRMSGIDPWFIENIHAMVELERSVRQRKPPLDRATLRRAKQWGYTDAQIARLTGGTADTIRAKRKAAGIVPGYDLVDTCAAEFESRAPYYYSTYSSSSVDVRRTHPVMILGGGPNRIGQGIEFDYCCVRAAQEARRMKRDVIMLNCNPETVSTDPDISDRLYFEPLTFEDVMNVVDREKPAGVIIQLGGQTPLNLCRRLKSAGVPILGTDPDDIDVAEDRKKFQRLLVQIGLHCPEHGVADSLDQARRVVRRIGFPVLVRPSYVLGGRAMRIVLDEDGLEQYLTEALEVSEGRPLLIDRYLRDAVEVDVDALSDGRDTAVVGVLEHVEEAGIHSGDSACFYPPITLGKNMVRRIRESTLSLGRRLRVKGLLNVQYAVQGDDLYVLEVNPRASRTVPFVSKAVGIPMVDYATRIMLGEPLKKLLNPDRFHMPRRYCVKEAVLPFARFSRTDIALGPEMRSTGEVMGISRDPGMAFAKAQEEAGFPIPVRGRVLISVQDRDKDRIAPIARDLSRLGYQILATPGTARLLKQNGVAAEVVRKETALRDVKRLMERKQLGMIINTFRSTAGQSDFKQIRILSQIYKTPVMTTCRAAAMSVEAARSLKHGRMDMIPLQDL